jgi:hypothetical protein
MSCPQVGHSDYQCRAWAAAYSSHICISHACCSTPIGRCCAVFNALVVILLGSIVVELPSSLTPECPSTVRAYVQGLLFAAYALLILMAAVTFSNRVTIHIRWPYFALLGLFAFHGAWAFIGIGAVTAAGLSCWNNAPFLFAFAIAELVLTPFLIIVCLLKWFASTMWRCLVSCVQCQCCSCCQRRRSSSRRR